MYFLPFIRVKMHMNMSIDFVYNCAVLFITGSVFSMCLIFDIVFFSIACFFPLVICIYGRRRSPQESIFYYILFDKPLENTLRKNTSKKHLEKTPRKNTSEKHLEKTPRVRSVVPEPDGGRRPVPDAERPVRLREPVGRPAVVVGGAAGVPRARRRPGGGAQRRRPRRGGGVARATAAGERRAVHVGGADARRVVLDRRWVGERCGVVWGGGWGGGGGGGGGG